MDHDIITALCGIIVGFALGLTGGGGSIFAVPMLIYILGVDVRTAVGVSLAAVGATSAFGVMTRLRGGEIDYKTGLIFAVSGMLSTPLGTWTGTRLPQSWVLLAFAILMLIVGIRMWRHPKTIEEEIPVNIDHEATSKHRIGEWVRLIGIGIIVGLITGIFGVGGGFIIVPALVLFGGVPIHRAVGTSLLVITLICISGVSSFLISGQGLPGHLTLIFVMGGCLGMFSGGLLRKRLTGDVMRRTFAIAMGAVALFVIFETVWLSKKMKPEEKTVQSSILTENSAPFSNPQCT